MKFIQYIVILLVATSCVAVNIAEKGGFLWLEEIKSPKSTNWVDKQNALTLDTFASTENFQSTKKAILDTYNSKSKLRRIKYIGDEVMYIEQNQEHPKGILYAMTVDEAKKKNPQWRKLVDFDELSKKESRYLVFANVACNPFNSKLCVIGMSIGGSDREEFREFDLRTDSFVEGGFYLKEGIANLKWHDNDSLIYTTTLGEKKNQLSTSGYSLSVKLLLRGQDPKDSEEIFRAKDGVDVIPTSYLSDGKSYTFLEHWHTFDDETLYYYLNGKPVKLNTPLRMALEGVYKGRVLLRLFMDWEINGKKYKSGDLVGLDLSKVASSKKYKTELIFRPLANQVLNDVAITKSSISLLVLEDVKTKVVVVERNSAEKFNSGWKTKYITNPTAGSVRFWSTSTYSNEAIVMIRGFVNPSAIYFMDSVNNSYRLWDKSPNDFVTENLSHEYYFAVDKDGVKIPYQVVGPKNRDPKKHYPTLMYVYGGHGVARTAWYRADIGLGWLVKGGVFVVANVRGGGEYGTQWHQAAVRTKKHQTVDDIATIAKDMFKRNITDNKRLGVYGVSSGGFSTCSTLVRYPELINAAICKAPLTDMMRYTQLFAGKSWISEYGDPEDPVEGKYWQEYSPYQNIKEDIEYPPPLLIAWKNDDRVHPSHARRMVAKMKKLNHEAYYYESPEGGHGGGTGAIEKAQIRALEYEYFAQMLFDK